MMPSLPSSAPDPARQAVVVEFHRAARRALRCAKALRTCGLITQGATGHGLRLTIGEAAAAMGEVAFKHDAEWLTALAALHEDPDAPLPGLPDPEDAAGGRAPAAA